MRLKELNNKELPLNSQKRHDELEMKLKNSSFRQPCGLNCQFTVTLELQ